jgi:hypothetical protein
MPNGSLKLRAQKYNYFSNNKLSKNYFSKNLHHQQFDRKPALRSSYTVYHKRQFECVINHFTKTISVKRSGDVFMLNHQRCFAGKTYTCSMVDSYKAIFEGAAIINNWLRAQVDSIRKLFKPCRRSLNHPRSIAQPQFLHPENFHFQRKH